MPIPAPGNVDMATQSTVLLVKAKTDIIGASVALEAGGNIAAIIAKTNVVFNQYFYWQILPRRGRAVQGAWVWYEDATVTIWLTDINLDLKGYWRNNDAAINDEYAYPVFLPAGTYNLELYYLGNTNCGILTLKLGDTTLGTHDMYGGVAVPNVVTTMTFTVAADTAAPLRFIMASKHASSTAYRLNLQKVTLWRTT